MPDEDIRLALRTADQARTDFAIIEDELEAIHARLARLIHDGGAAATEAKGCLGFRRWLRGIFCHRSNPRKPCIY
jgi:hypothetical protein